jgi:hypothetical protein
MGAYAVRMAYADDPQRTRVGIRLIWRPDDVGGWLADAAAFDAAGADALWIDVAGQPELDPLALAAALAAVTFRGLLVAPAIAAADAGRLRERERAVETVTQLSRGRLRVIGDGDREFHQIAGNPRTYEDAARRWADAPLPDSRTVWREMLDEAAGAGLHGLVIPAGARLLDLLRNPGDPGQRRDLELSVG